MLDDSIAFDGETPDERPLGGAEKAFVRLAEALAMREHEVAAFTRCEMAKTVNGVDWLPWDTPRPPWTDVLLAFRKPALLQEIDDAEKKTLWVWNKPDYLNKPVAQAVLEAVRPAIVFTGEFHRRSWKPWREFKNISITPGVGDVYLIDQGEAEEEVLPPPVAITTTHPLHGLDKIVQLWRRGIHPENEAAELHIYSAALMRAKASGEVDPRLAGVFAAISAAESQGIRIKAPMADAAMADAYRAARLHFYPLITGEAYASTLAESQAAGLPAVVLGGGGDTRLIGERVRNGQSAYIAPDDSAVENLSLEILADEGIMYKSLHRDALTLQRGPNWREAAIEFEELWG